MPIGFRCQNCRKKLSTAKRKAGSTVTCPGCGASVLVPDADTLDPKVERLLATAGGPADDSPALPPLPPEAETEADPQPLPPLPPPPALPPLPPPPPVLKARRVQPSAGEKAAPAPPKPAPAKPKLEDMPLFEREDFAQMLERGAADEEDREPLPLPRNPEPTPAPDGFLVTRGTATMIMVAVVVLLGLAFAAGFLVGGRG